MTAVTSAPPLGNKVPGRGNLHADIFLCGEAPGIAEEMQRKPLVGKSGRETDRYLLQAGIRRADCYATNVVKHRPTTRAATGNVKPTAADIRRDEGELVHELETVRPTFVVAIGAVAAKWFLGKTFKNMESDHSFAFRRTICFLCGDRYDTYTVDDSLSGESSKDRNMLVVDGREIRNEDDVRRNLAKRKNRTSSPSSLDVVSTERTTDTGTGTGSRPVRQHKVCKSKSSKTGNERRKHHEGKRHTSNEPAEDSLQTGAPVRRQEHVCRDGRGARQQSALPNVQTSGRVQMAGSASAQSCHDFVVIPCYHPAAGLHQPEAQPLVMWDFQQLGKYVRGDLPCVVPRDMHPDPDYYEPANSVSLIQSLPIAIDTEGLAGRVWGLSYSQIPGSAGVIRATNRKALASFKRQLLGGR